MFITLGGSKLNNLRLQIVHGNLAARNMLVFSDHVVKISNLGMSKYLYERKMKQRVSEKEFSVTHFRTESKRLDWLFLNFKA